MVRPQPDHVLDNSSPYFVHPDDGPSSVVVTPLLTGSNYHSWSRSMKRALGAKMKLDFITGALPMPEDDFDPAELCSWRTQLIYGTIFMNASHKTLREELELYLPIPSCTCRQRCACEAMRSARRNHTLLHTVRFLTGLNENFSTVRSQILIMEPLPPINKVFSLVIQHERQGNFSEVDDSKILVNAAKSAKSSSSSKASS
ncbi:hypothetical protein L195_g050209, partial [Trifolium pratense]